jgi:hypothetical protein
VVVVVDFDGDGNVDVYATFDDLRARRRTSKVA